MIESVGTVSYLGFFALEPDVEFVDVKRKARVVATYQVLDVAS